MAMSHPTAKQSPCGINDNMFEQAFEAGIERGYIDALKDVMEFLPSPNAMIPVKSILKFIEQKLNGK